MTIDVTSFLRNKKRTGRVVTRSEGILLYNRVKIANYVNGVEVIPRVERLMREKLSEFVIL